MEPGLSLRTARRLEEFVATANKRRLTLPDMQRWKQFVVGCHLDHETTDRAVLRAALTHCGFAIEDAGRLVDHLVLGLEVLRAYDEAIAARH